MKRRHLALAVFGFGVLAAAISFLFLKATSFYRLTYSFDIAPPIFDSEQRLDSSDFQKALVGNLEDKSILQGPRCVQNSEITLVCSIALKNEQDVERVQELWSSKFPGSWNYIPRELLILRTQENRNREQDLRLQLLDLEESLDSLYEGAEPVLSKIDALSGDLQKAMRERQMRSKQRDVISQSLPDQPDTQRPIFERKLAELNAQIEDLKERIGNVQRAQEDLEQEAKPYLDMRESKKELEKKIASLGNQRAKFRQVLDRNVRDAWLPDPQHYTIQSASMKGDVEIVSNRLILPWAVETSALIFFLILSLFPVPERIRSIEELTEVTGLPFLGELTIMTSPPSNRET